MFGSSFPLGLCPGDCSNPWRPLSLPRQCWHKAACPAGGTCIPSWSTHARPLEESSNNSLVHSRDAAASPNEATITSARPLGRCGKAASSDATGCPLSVCWRGSILEQQSFHHQFTRAAWFLMKWHFFGHENEIRILSQDFLIYFFNLFIFLSKFVRNILLLDFYTGTLCWRFFFYPQWTFVNDGLGLHIH